MQRFGTQVADFDNNQTELIHFDHYHLNAYSCFKVISYGFVIWQKTSELNIVNACFEKELEPNNNIPS